MGTHRPVSSHEFRSLPKRVRQPAHYHAETDSGLGALAWGGALAMAMAVVAYFAFSKPVEFSKPRRGNNAAQKAAAQSAAPAPASATVSDNRSAQPYVRPPVVMPTASAAPGNSTVTPLPTPPPRPSQRPEGGGGLLSTFGSSRDDSPREGSETETPRIGKATVPDAVAPPEKK